jgi:serpin B
MTYAGARGNTEQQMAEVLHFTLPQGQLHPAFKALNDSLPGTAQKTDDEGEDFQLNIANALWAQSGLPFRADYVEVVQANYGAGWQLLDFMADPEAARVQINNWVSQQTQDRIRDLIAPGVLNALTRLVLTNAIYFKATWASLFDEAFSQDGSFTRLDGSQESVPMMGIIATFGYAQEKGSYQAVSLPYVGERVAMLILLPDASQFESFESRLDADQLGALLDSLAPTEMKLTMPPFGYETVLDLTGTLQALGMTDAFSEGAADFSGMTGERDLFLNQAIHKAFIKVDETGTEAAAATFSSLGLRSAPDMPSLEVDIDRPFIYLIYDQQTGTILFVGRVLDPAA